MDFITEAKRVFDIEIDALIKVRDSLGDIFEIILYEITSCKGKVIVTGIGKPGHIAAKLAATFSSLGTQAFCLHPAEAMHGDLGMISEFDVVIALSYSGESDEIIRILPNIKMIGAKLIALTGNKDSTLAKYADIVQVLPKFQEACYLGLAPTSSTTTELVYGDALAVVASAVYGFKESDFGRYHPAGSLGKKLVLKVNDLMLSGDDIPTVLRNTSLVEAIKAMSGHAPGMVAIVDEQNNLKGIITDGDLRRLLEKKVDVYSLTVDTVMTKEPVQVSSGAMAVEVLSLMKEKNISFIPVMEKNKVIGMIGIHDILRAGIAA